jgi:hypothetical protein
MQQWKKGARRKKAATSEKRENKTSGRIFRKTAELEIENRIVGSLTGLWK